MFVETEKAIDSNLLLWMITKVMLFTTPVSGYYVGSQRGDKECLHSFLEKSVGEESL